MSKNCCLFDDEQMSLAVVGKPFCSSVKLFGTKPESGLQQYNLIVGSNRSGDFEMMSRCR